MMNLLKGSSVYLAGAVDHSDNPREWRINIAESLLSPMGVKVYDPLLKPSWSSPAVKEAPKDFFDSFDRVAVGHQTITFRDRYLWNGMATIRRLCLRMVADCNFMIVSLPKKLTFGTLEELKLAVDAGKPVLLYMPDGVISTWLPLELASTLEEYRDSQFQSWSDLYSYLKAIDSGEKDVDKLKWLFLSYHNDSRIKNEISTN